MPESELQPKPKPARDPQALSSEYHKARKQLMLWAGILFIWELVGIDLEKAKDAGGNAGAIITAIKSPQAVPWVLLILVAYFLFKTTVEWYQCSLSRRGLRVSKIDFGSAWITSVAAYGLYIYQAVKKVQFADTVQSGTFASRWLLLGSVFGFTFTFSLFVRIRTIIRYNFWRTSRRTAWTGLVFSLMWFGVGAIMLIILRLAGIPYDWISLIKGLTVGLSIGLLSAAAMIWGGRIISLFPKLKVFPFSRDQ